MIAFYGWGSTASRLEPLRRETLTRDRKKESLHIFWDCLLELSRKLFNCTTTASTKKAITHTF